MTLITTPITAKTAKTNLQDAQVIAHDFVKNARRKPWNCEDGDVYVSNKTLDTLFDMFINHTMYRSTRDAEYWRMEIEERLDGDRRDAITMVAQDQCGDVSSITFIAK